MERLVLKSTGASPVKRFMPSLSARADSLDVEATPSFVSLAMSGCWPLVLLKARDSARPQLANFASFKY